MQQVQVTLTFPSAAEAVKALARLDGPDMIRYEDRPDVGGKPLAPTELVPTPLPPVAVVEPAPSLDVMFGATPPAPPVAATAAVPSVPVPPVAGSPDLDSQGLPWDSRIHGSTKSKNADGTWRQKRGLNNDTLKAQVEAELRAAMGAPAAPTPPPAAPTAPIAAVAPIVAPVVTAPVLPLPVPPVPPALPPAETAAITPPVPVAAGPESFGQFMARTAPLFASDPAGTGTKMGQALAMSGLSAVGQLAARPDLIPGVAATFDALVAA